MQDVPQELWQYARSEAGAGTPYAGYHRTRANPELLRSFLFATMDEVRLRHAEDYAREVLAIIDCDDADHFRRGVLRREVIGEIAFARQRDHAAHTLHNYLLGWYILSKNMVLRNHLFTALERRLLQNGMKISMGLAWTRFGNIWPFASLLHDIGYLFEGVLEATDPSIQTEMVRRGLAVVRDYFSHRYWFENNVGSIEKRDRLRRVTFVTEPDFSDYSLAAVADTLRDLGTLEHLSTAASLELVKKGLPIPAELSSLCGPPKDAFDVWKLHYKAYDITAKMQKRFEELRSAFETYIWQGLPNLGIRILDHGVCSGLLALQFSTFFFRMFFALRKPPSDPLDAEVWGDFTNRKEYDPKWWWTTVLWGTGAAAIHNIQQMRRPWIPGGSDCGPLHMDEDPLAYLGILVDILQEWDRYAVRRGASLAGSLPLQGKDVGLGVVDGIVVVDYRDALHAKDVSDRLDIALEDWRAVARILPD